MVEVTGCDGDVAELRTAKLNSLISAKLHHRLRTAQNFCVFTPPPLIPLPLSI